MSADILQLLSRTPPFTTIPKPQLDSLARRVARCVFAEGEIIAAAGSNTGGIKLLASGRLSLVDEFGATQGIVVPGNYVDLIHALCEPSSRFSVRAARDSQLVVFDPAITVSLFEQDPALRAQLLKIAREADEERQVLLQAISHDHIEARIAGILLALAPRSSSPQFLDSVAVEVKELAATARTSESMVERVLKVLERQEVLALPSPGSVTLLDVDSLSGIASIAHLSA